MLKITLNVIAWVLLIICILLIAAYITGRDKRAYSVLNPNDVLKINGQTNTVQGFSSIYSPFVFKQIDVNTPPLLWIWYNAVDSGDHIDFIYYFVWENEINPNPVIHSSYSIFRAFYYGYPLLDIEYFQVEVSKSDGKVVGMMFETGPSDDFYSIVNEHIVVRASMAPLSGYNVRYINRSTGVEIKVTEIIPQFTGSHVDVGVQTWNHLSTLISAGNVLVYTKNITPNELKFLSDIDYSNYKFVRKSQGSHVTNEYKMGNIISAIAIFIIVIIPAKIISNIKTSRRK